MIIVLLSQYSTPWRLTFNGGNTISAWKYKYLYKEVVLFFSFFPLIVCAFSIQMSVSKYTIECIATGRLDNFESVNNGYKGAS